MIVGIVGYIGSGKGEISKILKETHGFEIESMASPVKDIVSILFNWDRLMLEGATKESREWREKNDPWWSEKLNCEFSPRSALQKVGTEMGRNFFHEDIWINHLLRRTDPNKNYVISDIRFPNEINMIRENGGKVFRVIRGEEPEWYDIAFVENTLEPGMRWILEDRNELMQQLYPNVHHSEWAWIGCEMDDIIENNGSLEDLQKNVKEMLSKHL
jgi:hypothetical protein